MLDRAVGDRSSVHRPVRASQRLRATGGRCPISEAAQRRLDLHLLFFFEEGEDLGVVLVLFELELGVLQDRELSFCYRQIFSVASKKTVDKISLSFDPPRSLSF